MTKIPKAHTQYEDMVGTASVDLGNTYGFTRIADMLDIDKNRYDIKGFSLFHSANTTTIEVYVFDTTLLKNGFKTIDDCKDENDNVPLTKLIFNDPPFDYKEFLDKSIERLKIVVTDKGYEEKGIIVEEVDL